MVPCVAAGERAVRLDDDAAQLFLAPVVDVSHVEIAELRRAPLLRLVGRHDLPEVFELRPVAVRPAEQHAPECVVLVRIEPVLDDDARLALVDGAQVERQPEGRQWIVVSRDGPHAHALVLGERAIDERAHDGQAHLPDLAEAPVHVELVARLRRRLLVVLRVPEVAEVADDRFACGGRTRDELRHALAELTLRDAQIERLAHLAGPREHAPCGSPSGYATSRSELVALGGSTGAAGLTYAATCSAMAALIASQRSTASRLYDAHSTTVDPSPRRMTEARSSRNDSGTGAGGWSAPATRVLRHSWSVAPSAPVSLETPPSSWPSGM